MIERLILTLVICALGVAAFQLLQLAQQKQLSSLTMASSSPSILYFRSDSCAACSTQKRFLDELQQSADVEINTIDVMKEVEEAERYNIMTLPTTIVVDKEGQVKKINYGLADARTLARQMES